MLYTTKHEGEEKGKRVLGERVEGGGGEGGEGGENKDKKNSLLEQN